MLERLSKRLVCKAGGIALAAALGTTAAHAEVKLDVIYAAASVYKSVIEEMTDRFMKEHPDIKVQFRNPPPNYEELAQQVLRDKITNSLPDIVFNGINQIGVFVGRDLVAPLDGFADKDGGLEKLGYHPALGALGKFKGKLYGIPYAVSMPIVYVNMDLLAKAGIDPASLSSWPAIIKAGKAIDAKVGSPVTGFYFDWEQTGNWLVQALITSHGGRVLKDDRCSLGFNDQNGLRALQVLESFGASKMRNLGAAPGRQAYVAGNVGILVTSSGFAAGFERQVGKNFGFKTLTFPVASENARLPGGGSMALVLSTDQARQKAAWEYVKFATGGIGQAIMAKGTGYVPVNEAAVTTPELLGNFYKEFPNQKTALQQLPRLTEWVPYPGDNSLKIIEVIKGHAEALISGRSTAEKAMPALVKDVTVLLPKCSG
jgi:multiple sugar transport system substrate-binding protein